MSGHVLASHEDKSVTDLAIDLEKHPELRHSLDTGRNVIVNDVSESKESYFARLHEAAGVEPVVWVGKGSGPRSLSTQKIKDAGYAFLDPNAEHDGEALL